MTVDGYLKRLNPQIPGTRRGPPADRPGLRHLLPGAAPRSRQILRNTVKTTGTLEGREAKLKALFNDVAAFSDTTKGFLDDNGDNLIRLSQVSAQQLRGAGEVLPGVPLPARRGRERREAPGRGVPQLHAAHRARDAAEPAPRLQPERPAAARRRAGPQLPDPAQPRRGRRPTPRSTRRTSTTASTSPPARAPSRVAPSYYRADRAGSPEESALLKSLLGPGARA